MKSLERKAKDNLIFNDRGGYTFPTHNLYPAQWCWDSCFVAMGFATFDIDRAILELENLFKGQWKNGMVPHIVFHENDLSYFPNSKYWNVLNLVKECNNVHLATSGITQPPVASIAIRWIIERYSLEEKQSLRIIELIKKIMLWHNWFYAERNPMKTNLVNIFHPWESGMDNSPNWDDLLKNVKTDELLDIEKLRKDTTYANANERPTTEEYKKYINLVENFKKFKFNQFEIHKNNQFSVIDTAFNSILMRANIDLIWLHDYFKIKNKFELKTWNENAFLNLDTLWSSEFNQYGCYDLNRKEKIFTPSISQFFILFAGEAENKNIPKIIDKLKEWLPKVNYLMPSFSPYSDKFDPSRYWRGPVWLIVNWIIYEGLVRCNETTIANRIKDHSIKLIEISGFREYYNPIDGSGCGGRKFSWTSSLYLSWLNT
jgi:hypothetical protein|tara:strand:+ start:3878 stop:5167 length:1290 start_codon:yes stop_codon:yes gene_type:complete